MLSNVRCFYLQQTVDTYQLYIFFCFHFWMPCCVNAVFKVLVGLRAEKQRDSGQEPNLTVE